MTDPVKDEGVNSDDGFEDVVTEDLSDVVSPDGELETHNPDVDEYDDVLKELEAFDDSDDDTSGGTEKTDDSEGDSDADDAGTDDGKEGDDDDPRIPKARLDEVISQRDTEKEGRIKAETHLSEMEKRINALESAPKPAKEPEPLPLDDLLGKDKQEVIDAFSEDPQGFLANLEERIEAKNRLVMDEQKEADAAEAELTRHLDAFEQSHEDFMPNVPKIAEALESNPIHNAVSAYYEAVKVPSLEAKVTELEGAVESAKKEGVKLGRKEAIEAVRAKGLSATLDGSSSSSAPEPDDELQDTEKHGGIRELGIKQLIERRKSRGEM